MKFSEAWLREWVNPAVTTEQLVEQLTMAGLEVDNVTSVAPNLSGIVVGEVLSVAKHPDADKLTVCGVSIGTKETLQIVCGAPNVRTGMFAPVAVVGARMPGGREIKRAKLRGVESSGMLCSASELGLAENSAGLMELPHDGTPGTPLKDYLLLDDHSIEVDLTPNRSDCLSVAGIAREVGVLNHCDLTRPAIKPVASTIDTVFDVDIEAPQACPRYIGRVIMGVNPKATAPLWMQERLRRSGLRSISAIVDVTNYVLLELGQPMHAFDLKKLTGGIRVRYARTGEKIELLDGQAITLDSETLVIADHKQARAMAGIMGGLDSAVTDSTDTIFLESAYFTPDVIAGRARHYGLHTDSSHRFERGVDPELARVATERATALLLEIVGGKAGPVIEAVIESELPKRQVISLRAARLERVLGTSIPGQQVSDSLQRLGMSVEDQGDAWQVTPPGFRFDIAIEADLIEEVARIYGYNRLPNTRPTGDLAIVSPPPHYDVNRRIRGLLVDRGYCEAVTYSFVDPRLQKQFAPDTPAIALANPISEDMSEMRTSLWPGLVQAVVYNLNRQQSRARLFECGLKYIRQDKDIKEIKYVAGITCGSRFPEQWGVDRKRNGAVDFYDVKADVEALLALSGAGKDDFRFEAAKHPALQPGRTARIVHASEGEVGWLGDLHPAIAGGLGIAGQPVVFELREAVLRRASEARFTELSKFPAIRRDLAFIVSSETEAQAVQKTISQAAGGALAELQLFDVFRLKGVDSGKKSLAFGLTVQEFSRTLTDREVDALIDGVIKEVSEKHNAKLRD